MTKPPMLGTLTGRVRAAGGGTFACAADAGRTINRQVASRTWRPRRNSEDTAGLQRTGGKSQEPDRQFFGGALGPRDQGAEILAAGLEVAELVEARAGGREQDDVAGARRGPRRGQGVVECREALARQPVGVLAVRVRDEVALA